MAGDPNGWQRTGHDEILSSLRQMIKAEFVSIRPADYVKHLKKESDRGAIILAASLVDDALKEALGRKLEAANSDEKTRIFDHMGSLGTFSSKIALAQALSIISRTVRKQIEIIKECRNVAAHAHIAVDFTTPQVVTGLVNMFDDEAAADVASWTRVRLRDTFILLCGIHADYIMEHDKTENRTMNRLLLLLKLPRPAHRPLHGKSPAE